MKTWEKKLYMVKLVKKNIYGRGKIGEYAQKGEHIALDKKSKLTKCAAR